MTLTTAEIEQFHQDGYVFPVDILGADEVAGIRSQLEKVEPMTLKAWLRERVEAGDPIPLDLFGAFITQRATIKRSK